MAKEMILVADDEQHIRDLLTYNLEQSGYEVIQAENGRDALQFVGETRPDLIVLDMMMPVMGGEVVCREIKQTPVTAAIPIIILSAISEEADKILALENGADDYMTKPFSVRELIARIRALLRTSVTADQDRSVLKAGPLVINTVNYEVLVDNHHITLTLKEYELIKMLIEQQGRVLTRDYLLDRIWGYDFFGESRTVDVHVRHLRQKLGEYADCIHTIRGVGYKYVQPK